MKFNKEIIICADVAMKVCPKQWDNLTDTEEDYIRFCKSCKHKVYFCDTPEEVMLHAQQEHCVAYAFIDRGELPTVYMGVPEPLIYTDPLIYPDRKRGTLPTANQKLALKLSQRESQIYSALNNAAITTRRCADCHAPMPSWEPNCVICGCSESIEKTDIPQEKGNITVNAQQNRDDNNTSSARP